MTRPWSEVRRAMGAPDRRFRVGGMLQLWHLRADEAMFAGSTMLGAACGSVFNPADDAEVEGAFAPDASQRCAVCQAAATATFGDRT